MLDDVLKTASSDALIRILRDLETTFHQARGFKEAIYKTAMSTHFWFAESRDWQAPSYDPSVDNDLLWVIKEAATGLFELGIVSAANNSTIDHNCSDCFTGLFETMHRIKCEALGFDPNETARMKINARLIAASEFYELSYVLVYLCLCNDRPIQWPYARLFQSVIPFLISDDPLEMELQLRFSLQTLIGGVVGRFEDETEQPFPWEGAVNDALDYYFESVGMESDERTCLAISKRFDKLRQRRLG